MFLCSKIDKTDKSNNVKHEIPSVTFSIGYMFFNK
jgi:hypothetical protein